HVRLRHDRGDVTGLHRAAVEHAHGSGHLGGVQLGEPGTDRGTHFLGVLRGGHLAGADRPDRLVGDGGAGSVLGGDACVGTVHLGEGVRHLLTGLPHLEPFTHADDRGDVGAQGSLGLRPDQRVVLTVLLTSLGVAHDGVAHPELGQHGGRDLTGVGTLLVGGDVLRAVADLQLVGVHQGLHRAQVGERWADHHLHSVVVVLGVLEGPGELLHQVGGLVVVEVHLPVARHQRGTAGSHRSLPFAGQFRTSIPGRVLPSRNSREAPPPVEMWLKPSSSKSRVRTAAAESPPPTMVTAPPEVASTYAWATALSPPANASSSNTPIGPFQTTVLAPVIAVRNCSPDFGPMSRPIWSPGMSSAATTVAGESALNSGATTMSVGS